MILLLCSVNHTFIFTSIIANNNKVHNYVVLSLYSILTVLQIVYQFHQLYHRNHHHYSGSIGVIYVCDFQVAI